MRWFIGIELSPELREEIAENIGQVEDDFRDVGWLESPQFFATLRFLGNPHKRHHKNLKTTLEKAGTQVAPFVANFTDFGCFPKDGAPRTVWLGFKDNSGMLERLQEECERAFSTLSIAERQPEFIPHIPIGRVSGKTPKGNLRHAVSEFKIKTRDISVSEICLVLSKLKKSGPSYEVVARAPLTANIAS